MPENYIQKISILNAVLDYFQLTVLGINFRSNENWNINCADRLSPNDPYVRLIFSFKENDLASISLQRVYGIDRKSQCNKIEYRAEIAKFLCKTLTFKKVSYMNGYYQLSCGNEVLAYYCKDVNGNYVEASDIKPVTFTDDDFGVQKKLNINLD